MLWKKEIKTKKSISKFFSRHFRPDYAVLWSVCNDDNTWMPHAFITLQPTCGDLIIWTNGGILLIGPLGTNFSEILVEFHTFSFKKMHLKMSSVKWRPFCFGLNVLILKWSPAISHISLGNIVLMSDSVVIVRTAIPYIVPRDKHITIDSVSHTKHTMGYVLAKSCIFAKQVILLRSILLMAAFG